MKQIFLLLFSFLPMVSMPLEETTSSCVAIKSVQLMTDTHSAPNGYQYSMSGVITPSKATSPKAYALKRNGEIIDEAVFSGGLVWFTYTENEVGNHQFTLEAVNCSGSKEDTISINSF